MTYRQTLRELAYDSHGVVTLAAAAGVPAAEVRKLASRGALQRLGKGVYRMLEAPHASLDEFAEAVALVGDDAVLVDEAVLAAHHLRQVNLRRIKVATGKRHRQKLPSTVEVVNRKVEDREREDIEGIPAMSVSSAILACREHVMSERLVDAARQAASRGSHQRARRAAGPRGAAVVTSASSAASTPTSTSAPTSVNKLAAQSAALLTSARPPCDASSRSSEMWSWRRCCPTRLSRAERVSS